jgi:hypothetical protein
MPLGSIKISSHQKSLAGLLKYWLATILLILVALTFVSGSVALLAAFVFTFLVPGLTFHRFFNLKKHELWAFIPVFSVLVSVTLIYFVSLIVGYSTSTILGCFAALTAIYTLVVYKTGESFTPKKILQLGKFSKTSLLIFAAIFALSFYVLYSSVWVQTPQGLIITGSNWQDTPFHYSIIESINQGNFPPQFPDYAGVKLTYHYFVDFHTAILEQVYGYLPKLLPVLNAVFILVFALSMYALAREFGRKAALIASIVGVFGWGFSYFGLFSALFNGQFNAAENYFFQYQGTFGLPPVFDNLLQQRPMLIGLPAFALVLLLLKDPDSKRRLFLAGLITGLVFEFHNVAFFCCGLAFIFMFFLNFNKKRFSKNYLYFLLPTALALPFIFQGGTPTSIGSGTAWIYLYGTNPFALYFLTLGIPFIVAFISLTKKGNNLLKASFIALILVPNLILLTPNPWDMYKFYVFAWVPIAALTGWFLMGSEEGGESSKYRFLKLKGKIWKTTKVFVVVLLVALSVLSSVAVVSYNLGTNYVVADPNEVKVGMWVRANTTQNSVFLTYPDYGIYCPPAFIGGRITVSSYINWPYGHGIPLEQIYQRENDLKAAYNGTVADLKYAVAKYGVSYVYVGYEESRDFPNCVAKFYVVDWLTPVYNVGGLWVFGVNQTAMG